jgi:hypothetical protein
MQQSEGVKEAMLRFYEAFTAYDVGSFDRLVSQEHESMVIGTHPTSGLTIESSGDTAFGMVGIRLEAGDALRGWEEGSVGWVADQPTFVLHQHGATIPTRLTAIMRQEDGERKLVQAYFCVDVPNEEAAT